MMRGGALIDLDYHGRKSDPTWTTHWQQTGTQGSAEGDDPLIRGHYHDMPDRFLPSRGRSVTWTATMTLYAIDESGHRVSVGTMSYGFENYDDRSRLIRLHGE